MDLFREFDKKNKVKTSDSVGDNERPETIRSIRKGEGLLDIAHREVDDMDTKQLKGYLAVLRDKWTAGTGVAGKLPDEVTSLSVTTADDTLAQLPEVIRDLLSSVAVKYEVTPEQIYDRYLRLRDELESYPIQEFKLVLEGAINGSLCFESGFIREIKQSLIEAGKTKFNSFTGGNKT